MCSLSWLLVSSHYITTFLSVCVVASPSDVSSKEVFVPSIFLTSPILIPFHVKPWVSFLWLLTLISLMEDFHPELGAKGPFVLTEKGFKKLFYTPLCVW